MSSGSPLDIRTRRSIRICVEMRTSRQSIDIDRGPAANVVFEIESNGIVFSIGDVEVVAVTVAVRSSTRPTFRTIGSGSLCAQDLCKLLVNRGLLWHGRLRLT